MKFLETLGSSLLFSVLFLIGMNLLFRPDLYKDDFISTILYPYFPTSELSVIKIVGGLLTLFSLLSLFFKQHSFDLVLLVVLCFTTAFVYSPLNQGLDEKMQISLALIAALLLQRKTRTIKRDPSLKKDP
jgi:hypothetical protein